MAYTPINWQTGDTITAEKMNKMDNGWGVSSTQLFSESVTTVAGQPAPTCTLTYAEYIDASSVAVTFDGTDYIVQANDDNGAHIYGEIGSQGPSFANYPFCIVSVQNGPNMLYTETAGTYTITVKTATVETGADFGAAVNQCVGPTPFLCQSGVTTEDEIYYAMQSEQRMLYFYENGRMHIISERAGGLFNFIPEESGVSAEISDGIFTVTIA